MNKFDKFFLKKRLPLLIFILVLTVYFLTARGYIGHDGSYSLRTSISIVEKGSLCIDEFEDGECKSYSKHGIGLALLWIPFVLVGKLISFLTFLPEDRLIPFLVSFYNVFFGAGACVLMFYITRHFGASYRLSSFLALALGFLTLSWPYGVSDFSEVTLMFFLLLTIYFTLKNTEKSVFLASVSFSFLILLKLVSIVSLPVFVVFIFYNNKSVKKEAFKRSFYFLFLTFLTLCFIFFLNYLRYRNGLETGYGAEATGFGIKYLLESFSPLLFGLDVGVFIYSPILLLGVWGYFMFFKKFKKEAMFFLSLIFVNFFIFAFHWGWGGGWCFGSRHLIPIIPLCLLPLFMLIKRKKIPSFVLVTFISVSLLIQVVGVLQTDQEYYQIRHIDFPKEISDNMPSNIIGMTILLKHKFFKNDNIYDLSEFGIESDLQVDVSDFETYKGLNLWYVHFAREYDVGLVKYIFIIFIPFIYYLFFNLINISTRLDKEKRLR